MLPRRPETHTDPVFTLGDVVFAPQRGFSFLLWMEEGVVAKPMNGAHLLFCSVSLGRLWSKIKNSIYEAGAM